MSLEVMMGGRERFAKGMEFPGNFSIFQGIFTNVKEFQRILDAFFFEIFKNLTFLSFSWKKEIVAF